MRKILLALATLLCVSSAVSAADFYTYRSGNTETVFQSGRGYVGFGNTVGNTTYYHMNQSFRAPSQSNYGGYGGYGGFGVQPNFGGFGGHCAQPNYRSSRGLSSFYVQRW